VEAGACAAAALIVEEEDVPRFLPLDRTVSAEPRFPKRCSVSQRQ
jgi:hypothetical protein